jgi:hypothetical protein
VLDQKMKKIIAAVVITMTLLVGGAGFYVSSLVEKEAIKQAKKIDYFNFKSVSASWFGRSITFNNVSIGDKDKDKDIEIQSLVVSDYGFITSKNDVKNVSQLTLTFNGIQTQSAYFANDGMVSLSLSLQKNNDDGAVLSAGFDADNINAVIKLNTDESVKSVMKMIANDDTESLVAIKFTSINSVINVQEEFLQQAALPTMEKSRLLDWKEASSQQKDELLNNAKGLDKRTKEIITTVIENAFDQKPVVINVEPKKAIAAKDFLGILMAIGFSNPEKIVYNLVKELNITAE